MQILILSIIRCYRDAVSGRPRTKFIQHVATVPADLANSPFGNRALKIKVDRACKRAALSPAETSDVHNSLDRGLKRL